MKKRIALLLATVMVLGMTACGGKTEQPAASGDTIKVAFICESLQNA